MFILYIFIFVKKVSHRQLFSFIHCFNYFTHRSFYKWFRRIKQDFFVGMDAGFGTQNLSWLEFEN